MNPRPATRRLLVSLLVAGRLHAQEPAADVSPERARANFARPIVLGPDDVRSLPEPPAGYKTPRADIARGVWEEFEYDSGVTGTRRRARVYLPPGYSTERRYPVLYLLHGIGGDQDEWVHAAAPQTMLDNLLADGAARPMILVLPNGRARPDDRALGNPFTPENAAAFADFERDLIEFLVPAVDTRHATLADREHRALAGLSMGGGQTLNFGLSHLDTFAWLGAFSPAPNTRSPAELVPDAALAREKLRLLYLSCGNQDGLINIAQSAHARLKELEIPHVWNVDDAGHDGRSFGGNLYHFLQRVFP